MPRGKSLRKSMEFRSIDNKSEVILAWCDTCQHASLTNADGRYCLREECTTLRYHPGRRPGQTGWDALKAFARSVCPEIYAAYCTGGLEAVDTLVHDEEYQRTVLARQVAAAALVKAESKCEE